MAAKTVHAVTGAFGFSGKYVARQLLDAGRSVVTYTNSPNRPNPFGGAVEARPFRFDDVDALAESMADVEVFYNTYWVRFNAQGFSHEGAVEHTLALFEAAKKAGVRRFVHISITNPDENSPLEYFRGKGFLERKLRESGLSHAILRPAVLFGKEDILINNIAWTLRHFPVYAMFGDGSYHIQPTFVEDLARLMVEQGQERENTLIQAVGEEDYTYLDLVKMLRRELGLRRPIIGVPPTLGYWASVLVGRIMGDIFVTKEEIDGLMGDLLHVPGAGIAGTKLSDWVRQNKDTLGKRYAGELPRRTDRTRDYNA